MVTAKTLNLRVELGSVEIGITPTANMGDCLGIYWRVEDVDPQPQSTVPQQGAEDQRLYEVAIRLRQIGDQLDQEMFLAHHLPHYMFNEMLNVWRSTRYFSDSFSMFFHLLAMLYLSNNRARRSRRRDSC